MESKTHSYNNITYNNLELTVPNDLKFLILKSNLEQHNLRFLNVKAGLSYLLPRKRSWEKEREIEKKRKEEREKGERDREREKTESERDFTVGRWNCLISVYRKNCTKIV